MAKVFSVIQVLICVLILYQSNCFGQETIIKSYHTIERRQATARDTKNEYQSFSQNSPANANNSNGNTERPATDSSMVVPFNIKDQPLLGVNGSGQRKDISELHKISTSTVVSDPIQPSNEEQQDDTAKKTLLKFPKKVESSSLSPNVTQSIETPEEQVIDTIDVPENDTLNELKKHVYVNESTDYHDYYNSTIYVNKVEADQIWESMKNISPNSMLSQSHRRAMTVELSFDFPFYGHPVRNITVATGGFLYTGEYVHSWLAATQYIAPLMANFDTSLSNSSFVRLRDNGTAFTVIWENVSLQDKEEFGKFTFSTTLHKNGDIIFTYFTVPIFVNSIQDDKHPVKVGLSDAYIIDKIVYFARRKTIYEYHRVNFANAQITNSTIIVLKALPTCLNYKDCVSCINHTTTFDCAWCPMLNRCSTGTDRKKQEWLLKGCDRSQITDNDSCPAIGERGNNVNILNNNSTNLPPHSSYDDVIIRNPNDDVYHTKSSESTTSEISTVINKELKASVDNEEKPKSVSLALGLLLPICLVCLVLMWILYAYRNPHTKSGQLLIHYRPSQWSWRRGEARYTAATIHM